MRRDIIAGLLAPGTRITEASLAARYGVSRIPVREALRALEAEGFVWSQVNVGSRVADIPVDDADDLFAVREALEIATARRAATRAAALGSAALGSATLGSATLGSATTPSTEWGRVRGELALLLDAGDAAIHADALDELVELDDRFHLGLAILSGSPTLGGLLRQLSGTIEWLSAADRASRGKRLWPDHRNILAAIDSGDEELAGQLMKEHVRQSRIDYLSRHGVAASADPAVSAAAALRLRAGA